MTLTRTRRCGSRTRGPNNCSACSALARSASTVPSRSSTSRKRTMLDALAEASDRPLLGRFGALLDALTEAPGHRVRGRVRRSLDADAEAADPTLLAAVGQLLDALAEASIALPGRCDHLDSSSVVVGNSCGWVRGRRQRRGADPARLRPSASIRTLGHRLSRMR